METKVEAFQRVFPTSDNSESVLNVLIEYMKETGVTVVSNNPVTGLEFEKEKITSVKLKTKNIFAKNFILATGGKSRPETGSTGDGFKWLKEIGHTVTEPEASLVPIAIKDAWVKRLQGVTLQNVKVSLFQNNAKQQSSKPGRILFTHFGLSGPTVLNMSRDIGELLKYGDVTISLDVLPELDYGQLNAKLQEIFKKHGNKKIKNSLNNLIPSALVPIIIELSKIDEQTWSHSITREQRLQLITALKAIHLEVKGLLGVEKAIVTSGGVSLDEVDFRTMKSRLFPNLYLIGDILNIDRPSGGFSLQLCWTTGFVAGDSISQ